MPIIRTKEGEKNANLFSVGKKPEDLNQLRIEIDFFFCGGGGGIGQRITFLGKVEWLYS